MHKHKAILFDLFDTIINFNFRHLPAVEMNGIRSRTTSKEVYSVFRRYYPEISFSRFYPCFVESYHQFQEMKLEEYREFPNRDRFILMFENMKITQNEKTDRLADEMVIAHMDGLSRCIEFPEENKRTLEKVKEKGYLTAIVSNFDYAPAAHALIDKYDIGRFFDQIVISEEVGWRKPKDIIFRRALELLNIEPEDALFVGDNFNADVGGAKAVGIRTVWLNKNHASQEAGPTPDYTIEKLPQLNEILS